jgi:hypothetical protein
VTIDVEQTRSVRLRVDQVFVENLVVERLRHYSISSKQPGALAVIAPARSSTAAVERQGG